MAKTKREKQKIYIKVGSILIGGIIVSLSIYFAAQGGFDLNINQGADGEDTAAESNCTGDNRLDAECFTKFAENIDLDKGKFEECVADNRHSDLLDREIAAAEGAGVQGTPALFIGKGEGENFKGFFAGSVNFEDVEIIVEKLETASVEETFPFWLDNLEERMAELEVTVRAYYASEDGGAMSGQELEDIVREIMDEQRAYIRSNVVMKDLSTGDGVVEGDGEIVLMVFSDYECPYCQEFAATILPTIKDTYVDSGKARFIFRDFPLEQIHPRARDAANAARCADDQGKYFEYHDQLFEIN